MTHPTAESVHAAARAEMETISLKTVYQTLNELAAMGEIAALDLGTGMTRFDPNVEGVHHHLVCRGVRQGARPARRLHRRHGAAGRGRGLRRERVPRSCSGAAVASAGASAGQRRLAAPGDRRALNADPPSRRTPTDEGEGSTVPDTEGIQDRGNLKEAFAGESQANRRYLYFAQKADVEGYPDVAALFRSVAEGETGHAFGHFDFLREVGDPVTGVPVGPTADNLKSAIEGETYEYTEMYPGFATHGARRGVRGDRRLARDAGPRREEPRRSLHRGLKSLTWTAPACGEHRLARAGAVGVWAGPARSGPEPEASRTGDTV